MSSATKKFPSPPAALMLILAATVLLGFIYLGFSGSFRFGNAGTGDFVQYWSAYQVLLQEGNPYHPDELYPMEKSVGLDAATALMYWSPPWLLTLMSPVLRLDFSDAAACWYFLNIAFGLVAVFAAYFGFRQGLLEPVCKNHNMLFSVLALGLLFPPFWSALKLGQSSVFLAAVCSLLFWALCGKRFAFAGALLAVLSIKAHLFYLVGIFLVWWLIVERCWRFFAAAAATLLLLAVLVHLQHPHALESWTEVWLPSESSQQASLQIVSRVQWQVGTAVSAVRDLIPGPLTWKAAALTTLLLPFVIAAVMLAALILKRPGEIKWKVVFPPLLCLSLFTAPYGWMFDSSVLLLAQTGIIICLFAGSYPRWKRCLFWSVLILHHGFTLYYQEVTAEFLHQLFWFPFTMMLLWFLVVRSGESQWMNSADE